MPLAPTRISELRSLLVDDMRDMRANLRNQLQQLGIDNVDQAQNAAEALKLLSTNKYDLVMCDYNLGGSTSGQQLLEFLKGKKLLPPSTIYFMVTAETSYQKVAAVGEFAPDDYLIKPFTASSLESRVLRQLEKQDALAPVMKHLSTSDHRSVIAECDRLIAAMPKYSMELLKLKAQAFQDLGRPPDAREVYVQVLAIRADVPWAQLGAARALKASGEVEKAKAAIESLIEANPQFIGAYDLLAEVHTETNNEDAAFATLRQAEAIAPSAHRARLVGKMAYQVGDLEVASTALEKVVAETRNSVTKSFTDTSTLSQVYVESGEPKKALELLKAVQKEFAGEPAFLAIAAAVESRAQRDLGNNEAADAAIKKAIELAPHAGAEAALAVSGACLAAGREEEGAKLLENAVRSNHENPRLVALAKRVLKQTGHAAMTHSLIDGQIKELADMTATALSFAKKAKLDEAVTMISEALAKLPDNAGVLLAAAQINLLWLSQKGLNVEFVNRVKAYMAKLESLMPGHERVLKLNHFFRETLTRVSAAKTLDRAAA